MDTVKNVVSRNWVFGETSLPGPDGFAARFLAWDHECCQLSQETIGYDPFWEQTHLRTIIGDHTSHDFSYDQLQDQYRIWKGWMEHLVRSEKITNDKWYACRPFYLAIHNACAKTRFFSTEKGRIGIGHPSLLLGDQLCVLINDRPVHILRRLINDNDDEQSLTKYILVGIAYVDGLMNGQAFELDDGCPKEIINIC